LRQEAAALASAAGCDVADGVTKHTTILVVGDGDLRTRTDDGKTAKHRKAEKLAAKGQGIRIIGESDFQTLVAI
jgi:DNA polymerase-3 subunit epsilon